MYKSTTVKGREIEKQINQGIRQAAKVVAEQANRDIEQMFEDSVDDFYEDYTPKQYKRTHSTYMGSDQYYTPTPPLGGKRVFEAGIEVSADNIYGEPYQHARIRGEGSAIVGADKEYVFERTFAKGLHGKRSIAQPLRPSPNKRIDRSMKKYMAKTLDKIAEKEIDKIFDAL